MSQVKILPTFGKGSPSLQGQYDLEDVYTKFEQLVEAERKNMKGKGFAGPQAKRLEFGEQILNLFQLMYRHEDPRNSWKKYYE